MSFAFNFVLHLFLVWVLGSGIGFELVGFGFGWMVTLRKKKKQGVYKRDYYPTSTTITITIHHHIIIH
jgi:hypothetical protein